VPPWCGGSGYLSGLAVQPVLSITVVKACYYCGPTPCGCSVETKTVSQLELQKVKLPKNAPPWGSKGLINRAGDAFRAGREPTADEIAALGRWRAGHKNVLNTFQAVLRNRTKGSDVQVAQRLKRRSTIIDKLFREKNMQLARMDDVAGCRLIFPDIPSLDKFRARFLKAGFNHNRRNAVDKYDYIKRPKGSGYRGVHDIYEYNPKSKQGKPYAGLLMELQYRTQAQHAWATAVEVVSRVTENQPKFDLGDERYKEFFKLTSEIIARVHERSYSIYKDIPDAELMDRFFAIDAEINMIRILKGLHTIYVGQRAGGNMILQFSQDGLLNIHEVGNDKDATDEYFRLEKENPNDDIVLVNADTFEEIRSAYRNYFSDPWEFLELINKGCIALGNKGCL
jgi:putative GTP pyrophosphokinase